MALFIMAAAVFAPLSTATAAQQATCQYVFGFAELHSQIPNVVGNCVTNEVHDINGNGYQGTLNGLLVWEKSSNTTYFTNGNTTWLRGPDRTIQSRLANQRFSWEPNPDGLPVVSDGSGTAAYYDDRSSEHSLIASLVNALNRREYLRAYSYWDPNSEQLPPFSDFQTGYANTATVAYWIGTITQDAGAGQRFSNVPVVLEAKTLDGQTQTFAGCFTLHLSVPAIQAAPPFHGWEIRSAQVTSVANNSDKNALLTSTCPNTGAGVVAPQPNTDPNNVSASRYLDDRSTAQQLLRSYVNALNRQEYLRAYSYWKSDATGLPTFADFEKGYATTKSVALTLGAVTSDAGAGQRYYTVPVVLVAQMNNGTSQTFTGCYELHLSEPTIQGTAPFQPLAIRSATVKQAAAGAGLPTC